ncbi:uncharacterized protein BXZ73DRAFT_77798 [Epithele typhae]|uniref:uncharacterized protein n=1 Tax=Epithele typhae TaxID=378194 RepID=UPI002008270F|nr:uncharacterized protein BXZ73DRAFT_77798 [Epithele typhae]KAH9931116.1 hypothetical protein BXZ73DRAFT_77798 [Epithele typhae]
MDGFPRLCPRSSLVLGFRPLVLVTIPAPSGMKTSGSMHTYAKRSTSLDPPLIGGIVGVVVIFNLVLVIVWLRFCNRRRAQKLHKRKISEPVDCEKYEKSVAFAVSTGAIPASPTPTGKSYYSLLQASNDSPRPIPILPTVFLVIPPATQLVLRPSDLKEFDGTPRYSKRRSQPHASGKNASAPMDYHDHLFRSQPFTLDPRAPASSPVWISPMPMPPAPAVISEASSLDFNETYPTPGSSPESEPTLPGTHSEISPIAIPMSEETSFLDLCTTSSPSKIRWITPKSPSALAAASPKSPHSKRSNSISSLSTIYSVVEATRARAAVPEPVTIAPLAVRRSRGAWGSVDLTRSTPISPPTSANKPAFAFSPPPALPARSPMRPPPSASVEQLVVAA